MKILIAEDEIVTQRLLENSLKKWGYEIIGAADGEETWQKFKCDDSPQLVLLDWMMPEMSGIDICRKIRSEKTDPYTYIILLTIKGSEKDIASGFDAGADDYIIKPFNALELKARLKVGERIINLQNRLSEKVEELKEVLSKVKQLQGLLPICAYCKSIRNDKNYWQEVEMYLSQHADVEFTHGVCPDCYETVVKEKLERLKQDRVASKHAYYNLPIPE